MKEKLGRLELVTLRAIWESELGKLTPWLASEASLKLLGDNLCIPVPRK